MQVTKSIPLNRQSHQIKMVVLSAGRSYPLEANTNVSIDQQTTLATSISGKSILEWLKFATGLTFPEIAIVSGYNAKLMYSAFPETHIVENPAWQNTGSAGSLLCVDMRSTADMLVCYGDILFRNNIVERLMESDAEITIAWDSHFKNRYADRPSHDLAQCEKVIAHQGLTMAAGSGVVDEWGNGEFIGLIRLTSRPLGVLQQLSAEEKQALSQLSLVDLVEWFRVRGYVISACDVAGDWAELNEPHDIAKFVLGTKAETLARLHQIVQRSTIQPQVAFSVQDWEETPESIMSRIRSVFGGHKVILRSSAKSEDSFLYSMAGAYTSVLNVDPMGDLDTAINAVCTSYEKKQNDDQVLVQPMVSDVVLSGVAFSRSLDFGAPYYIINYVESHETDAVTSGKNASDITYVVRRDAEISRIENPHLVALLEAIQELESMLNYDALDIEFALDSSGQVFILQVRPITVNSQSAGMINACLSMVRRSEEKWDRYVNPRPQVKGDFPVYGVMPDWNPAEIIGTNAGRLAVSLYRMLITDEIWARQRAEYGYKDVRPQPLLVEFCGTQYVDVRASFNSFVPDSVSDDLHEKLVNFYLNRLRENPQYHDKVEFEVLPTCLSFGTKIWRQRLLDEKTFTPLELDSLEDGLKKITQNAIDRTAGDMAAAEAFYARFDQIKTAVGESDLARANRLLEECRLYGTLPFAHLARSGFVAVTLLRDAVAGEILSQKGCDAFLGSIRTVSHEIVFDAAQVNRGALDWTRFVEIYGHLRPGTYDIQSPAYFEDSEQYLKPLVTQSAKTTAATHVNLGLWDAEKVQFAQALEDLGIVVDVDTLEHFLRTAIEGREKSKFIFTLYLSTALHDVMTWGDSVGLDRGELANLSIDEILAVSDGQIPISKHVKYLKKSAKRAAKMSQVAAACLLPELLVKKQDFQQFRMQEGQPNFIGTTNIQADCKFFGAADRDRDISLSGCVVMIPQADPGYDWIFGQNIAGLVTMYGGANSHMAIRAAEFGIPAAIGVGEKIYNNLLQARRVELDPRNKILRALQ